MGPWTGGRGGEVDQLRLSYHSMLAEQAFVVIYAHVSKLEWRRRRASVARLPTTQNVHSARGWARGDVSRFARQKVPPLGGAWVGQIEKAEGPAWACVQG